VTPECALNSDTAWEPSGHWRGAWGVTVEAEAASPEEETFHEIRALADGERVRVGGCLQSGGPIGSWPVASELVPALLPGDVLRCTLDATRRLFSWRLVRNGVTIAPRPTPGGGGGGSSGSSGGRGGSSGGGGLPSSAAAQSGGPSAGGAVLGGRYSQPGDQPLHSPFSLPLCGDSAEEHGPQGGPPPLALAVSLKFAGDTVSLWRIVEGEAAICS
jgi:hypothetical protein